MRSRFLLPVLLFSALLGAAVAQVGYLPINPNTNNATANLTFGPGYRLTLGGGELWTSNIRNSAGQVVWDVDGGVYEGILTVNDTFSVVGDLLVGGTIIGNGIGTTNASLMTDGTLAVERGGTGGNVAVSHGLPGIETGMYFFRNATMRGEPPRIVGFGDSIFTYPENEITARFGKVQSFTYSTLGTTGNVTNPTTDGALGIAAWNHNGTRQLAVNATVNRTANAADVTTQNQIKVAYQTGNWGGNMSISARTYGSANWTVLGNINTYSPTEGGNIVTYNTTSVGTWEVQVTNTGPSGNYVRIIGLGAFDSSLPIYLHAAFGGVDPVVHLTCPQARWAGVLGDLGTNLVFIRHFDPPDGNYVTTVNRIRTAAPQASVVMVGLHPHAVVWGNSSTYVQPDAPWSSLDAGFADIARDYAATYCRVQQYMPTVEVACAIGLHGDTGGGVYDTTHQTQAGKDVVNGIVAKMLGWDTAIPANFTRSFATTDFDSRGRRKVRIIKVLGSDVTVNNNASYTELTALTTRIPAGSNYMLRARIIIDSQAASDARLMIRGLLDTGAAVTNSYPLRWLCHRGYGSTAPYTYGFSIGQDLSLPIWGETTGWIMDTDSVISVNGDTGYWATVSIHFGQQTANATNTTVNKSSWLEIEQL